VGLNTAIALHCEAG
jgi:hypothetical protein